MGHFLLVVTSRPDGELLAFFGLRIEEWLNVKTYMAPGIGDFGHPHFSMEGGAK
ncbi:hypothetical protein [Streptomyces sp. H27-S2]|uniref:hypothetical protein n=1 Tax=Streptomyces antarcticus TaxID=2996458 RepID=UPI00226E7AE1|nr:hypothetical protein [Streptomyces sp. H27-S2]MCY0953701.1 hypothetical protein [Streptomyces sp. H27-S2]